MKFYRLATGQTHTSKMKEYKILNKNNIVVGLRSKSSTLFFIYSEINYERRARLMSETYLPENLEEILIGKRIIGVKHHRDVDGNTYIYITADDGTEVELKAIIQWNTKDDPQGTMIQVRGTIVNEVEFTIVGNRTEE